MPELNYPSSDGKGNGGSDSNEIFNDSILVAIGEIYAERRLILCIACAVPIIALIFSLFQDNVYRAKSLVSPRVQEERGKFTQLLGQFGGLAAAAGVDLDSNSSKGVDFALATLSSHQFIVRFVEEESIKSLLFPDRWDESNKQWKKKSGLKKLLEKLLMKDGSKDSMEPSDMEVYELFKEEIIHVDSYLETSMYYIGVEWTNPVVAAEWAKALVVRLNDQMRADAIEQASKSISYLENQLSTTTKMEMQRVLYDLVQQETAKKMFAEIADDYAFKVIDPATIPEKKIKPRRFLILLVSLIIGAVLGVFVAYSKVLVASALARSTKNTKL